MQILLFLILLNYSLQLKLKEIPFVTKTFVDSHKKLSKFKTFEHHQHPFKDFTMSQIKNLFGALDIDTTLHKISNTRNKENKINVFGALSTTISSGTTTSDPVFSVYGAGEVITSANLPPNYLVTKKFPNCETFVKNQGRCASCYAFAITEALSDRICVKTNMQTIVNLSTQLILNCGDPNYFGCRGARLDYTHLFLSMYGTVQESCLPYTSGVTGLTSTCPAYCVDGSQYKFYKFQNYQLFTNSDDMKLEIFKNGPIVTGFAAYSDFLNYKSGIYSVTAGATLLGGHAVKVIGWGIENGQKFWVAKNSWGVGWGEYGFFRFAEGNCCSFELNGIAAIPLF